ncbi:MAG TPA: hypothetical protein VG273_11745 [Bryobacteraceae bacterium]|jgi:hypothetical protein|nr:hypothetical protein [Bryobacteraceae bacterium]
MSLTLMTQPGFTELADTAFDAPNPLTADLLKPLNADAKFAAVRNEQFWGYYRNGETVLLPISAADAYQYSRAELVYTWSIYSTAPPTTALLGTQSTPTPGSRTGGGQLLEITANVNQTTGAVAINTAYFVTGGAESDTNDGILFVTVHAQRNR